MQFERRNAPGNVMTRPRRRFLRLAVGAAMLPALAPMAAAPSYPSRPVALVVPFAAGGPVDVLARIMAERMKVSLGQPVIIENVAGAGGRIGVAHGCCAVTDRKTH